MRAERQRLVSKYQSEGERAAKVIRATADGQANEITARAKSEAIKIAGEAETKAAEYYETFKKEPDLAVFWFQLKALEPSLKERSSLILGPQTVPFNLLNGVSGNNATNSPFQK